MKLHPLLAVIILAVPTIATLRAIDHRDAVPTTAPVRRISASVRPLSVDVAVVSGQRTGGPTRTTITPIPRPSL